jgi:hypothetical protein
VGGHDAEFTQNAAQEFRNAQRDSRLAVEPLLDEDLYLVGQSSLIGRSSSPIAVAYVNNSMSQFLQQAVGAQLRKVGITVKGMEAQHFGVLRSMGDNKAFSAVVLNSNSGVPNLAKFQVLDAKGGFNYYGNTDDTLTRLMEEASNLPVDKAEDAWKKVYGHVVEIAWLAPVAAIHVAYFASNAIKTPSIGQSVVIDLTDVEPAK